MRSSIDAGAVQRRDPLYSSKGKTAGSFWFRSILSDW